MLTPIRLLFIVIFIFGFIMLVKYVMDHRDTVLPETIETGALEDHTAAARKMPFKA